MIAPAVFAGHHVLRDDLPDEIAVGASDGARRLGVDI